MIPWCIKVYFSLLQSVILVLLLSKNIGRWIRPIDVICQMLSSWKFHLKRWEDRQKLIYLLSLSKIVLPHSFSCLRFCLPKQILDLKHLASQDIAIISCIQEKYKLSASLNSVFNTFRDLKFPKQSSNLFMKLTILSEKDYRKAGLLSINICLLYHKKWDWIQDGTSQLETK